MANLDTLVRAVDAEKRRFDLATRGVQILTHDDCFTARLALDIAFSGDTVTAALTALRCALQESPTVAALVEASDSFQQAFHAAKRAEKKAARRLSLDGCSK